MSVTGSPPVGHGYNPVRLVPTSSRRTLKTHPVSKAIYQGFLPTHTPATAYVWKYTPVNWGRRPRHFHIEPEFNLVTSGRAVFGIGNRLVEAQRGDLIGFPPGQDHVLVEASPDLFLFAIGMAPEFSSDILRGEDAVQGPLRMRLGPEDFKTLLDGATAIVDRDGVEQPCAELWQRVHWLARRREPSANPLHVLTRRTLGLLAHCPDPGLDVLAARFRSPASEVSRHFHRDVGLTFVQYRTRLRLLTFIRLMDTEGTSLMSAAEASYFGSYSQCHRAFVAELGCSPRDFFNTGIRQQMQLAYDP
jgi:AraC-like DNA-binding protein/mannose-6-phosphate isomerase-like protein (cupin superfamily)